MRRERYIFILNHEGLYQFERDLIHADFHDCHFPERVIDMRAGFIGAGK